MSKSGIQFGRARPVMNLADLSHRVSLKATPSPANGPSPITGLGPSLGNLPSDFGTSDNAGGFSNPTAWKNFFGNNSKVAKPGEMIAVPNDVPKANQPIKQPIAQDHPLQPAVQELEDMHKRNGWQLPTPDKNLVVNDRGEGASNLGAGGAGFWNRYGSGKSTFDTTAYADKLQELGAPVPSQIDNTKLLDPNQQVEPSLNNPNG